MDYMSPSSFSPSPIVQPPAHIQTAQAYQNSMNRYANINQYSNYGYNGYTNTNQYGTIGHTNTNQYGTDEYTNANQYANNGYNDPNQYGGHGYTNTNQYIDYYYDEVKDDFKTAYNNYNPVKNDISDRDEEAIDDTNIDTAYLIAKTFPEVFVLFSYGLALTIIIYGSLSFIEPYVGCPVGRGLEQEFKNMTKVTDVEVQDEESFLKKAFNIVNGMSKGTSSERQSSYIFFVDSSESFQEESKSSFSGSVQPLPLKADPRFFSLACGAVSRPFLTAFLVVWLPIIIFCFVTGYFVTDVNLFRKKDQDIEAVNINLESDYDYLDNPGENNGRLNELTVTGGRSWYPGHGARFSY